MSGWDTRQSALVLQHPTCKLYSKSNLRTKSDGVQFLRLKEDFPVGGEIVSLYAYPRNSILIPRTENSSDYEYFKLKEINSTVVSVILNRSLDGLVDSDDPQSILKFSVFCSGTSATSAKQDNSSFFTITVYIEDINDNDPEFINLPYVVTLDESTPIETVVFNRIKAIDRDKPNTPNSDLEYALAAKHMKSGDFPFRLEGSQRPSLVLQRALDYDAGWRSMSVQIVASDRGNPPRTANATIRVNLRDVDDLPPIFTRAQYRTRIKESFPLTGKPIHIPLYIEPPIMAFDQDSLNETLVYGIVAGNERQLFWISPETGVLFLQKEIDLDSESLPDNTFTLQIEAQQINDPTKSAFARVDIEVIDLNDNVPEFEVDLYNISIIENLPKGFSILQVNAIDRDQGENAEFYYYLMDEEPKGAFMIDHGSGWIVVRDETFLDKEQRSSLKMNVHAVERVEQYDRSRNYGKVQVEITLLDTNDNTPEFDQGTLYEFKTHCNASIGSKVGQIRALDPDDLGNGKIQYSIKNVRPNLVIPFLLDPDTGDIRVSEALTYGKIAFFVEARDQPQNPSESRFNVALVTIDIVCQSIEDIEFIGAPYEFWVGADAAIGSSVGQIRTTFDMVSDEEIFFDLLHSYPEGVPFAIEERSGIVTVIESMEKFDRRCYEFETVVSYLPDSAGKNVEQLTPEAYNSLEKIIVTNVTIHVIKHNFMLLRGTNATPIEFRVKENKPNTMIGQLKFQDFQEQCDADEKGLPPLISVRGDKNRADRQVFQLNGGKNRTRYARRFSRDVSRQSNFIRLYPLVAFDAVFSSTGNGTRKARNSRNPTSGVQYSLVNSYDVADTVRLTNDGKLMTIKGLDREKQDVIRVTIIAEYFYKQRTFAGIYQVVIVVEDENDNPPTFNQPFFLGVIAENSPIGTEIVLNNPIIISDMDAAGPNSEYELLLSGESNSFVAQFSNSTLSNYNKTVAHIFRNLQIANIDPGESRLRPDYRPNKQLEPGNASTPHYNILFMGPNKLDREEIESLTLKMMATDRDNLMSEVELKILILDVNDCAPVFERIAIFRKSRCEMIENTSDLELMYLDEIETEVLPEFMDAGLMEMNSVSYGVDSLFEMVQSAPYVGMPRLYDSQSVMVNRTADREHLTMRRKLYKQKVRQRGRNTRAVAKKSQLKFALPENVEVGKVIFKLTANDDDFEKNSKVFYEVVGQTELNSGERLSAMVDVEVIVMDRNDNNPEFTAYDDLRSDRNNIKRLPVYVAYLDVNAKVGTFVKQVMARDSDFRENGNGLVIYSLTGQSDVLQFSIDPKDGVVTTASKFTPSEAGTRKTYEHLNVTVVASDFGTPPRSSMALLIVNLQGDTLQQHPVEERPPLFPYKYYEIELRENDPAPRIVLNVTLSKRYANDPFRWEIVGDTFDDQFRIDERNGSLWLLRPLDREERDSYDVRIRVQKIKRETRNIPSVLYALENPVKRKSHRLFDNEVEIMIKVVDVNDNAPVFRDNYGPIISVVPDTANYGYAVMKVEATDDDAGSNGEVRYSLLNEPARLFAIDSLTGQIRLLNSLASFKEKVFGFDVKATDREGADDGKSTIANVFVYVLHAHQEVCLILAGLPVDIEKQLGMISSSLSTATGYDIRIRALETNTKVDDATNLYLYAIDRKTNGLVEMTELQRSLSRLDMSNLKPNLPIIELTELAVNSIEPHSFDAAGMKGIELATVVIGGLIFAGGTATALCIACARYRRLIPLPNGVGSGGGAGGAGVGGGSSNTSAEDVRVRGTVSRLGLGSNNNTTGSTRPITGADIQPVINRSDLKSSIFHPNFHRQFVTNISTEAVPEHSNEGNNSDSYEDSLKDSLTSNTSL
uniref:Cadherin domain-containing protein n=1 Tax=Anopheles coluzzii TaxID=1518534 RepID=A0A8W7PLQ8_ANOCL